MGILENTQKFEEQHARRLTISGQTWQYYRLGRGTPILWLTGGLRRAALGYAFLEKLAGRHVVVAPDYSPVSSATEFIQAFDAMLENEKIGRFILAGQSYGSLLAQAYLSERPDTGRDIGDLEWRTSGLQPGLADGRLSGHRIGATVAGEELPGICSSVGLRKVLPSGTGEQAEWLEVVRQIVMRGTDPCGFDITLCCCSRHYPQAHRPTGNITPMAGPGDRVERIQRSNSESWGHCSI